MSVRKAHNSGRNHLRNVVDYYQRKSYPISPSRLARLTPLLEIGHEKAQSVIDSITSSYAAEGQAHANPMLPQNQPGQGFPPPPFGFPGGKSTRNIVPPRLKEQGALTGVRYPATLPRNAWGASRPVSSRNAS
jgi:hypothetical protein